MVLDKKDAVICGIQKTASKIIARAQKAVRGGLVKQGLRSLLSLRSYSATENIERVALNGFKHQNRSIKRHALPKQVRTRLHTLTAVAAETRAPAYYGRAVGAAG